MKTIKIQPRFTPRDNKVIDAYMKEIANYPVLTADEEVELTRRVRAGDQKALDSMVKGNLKFVVSVAKNYMGLGLEFMDLVCAGNEGLLTAVHRFDETMGFKFCSYSVNWVQQSILKAIATNGRIVRLPANQAALALRIKRQAEKLEQELQRSPTLDELSDRTGVDKVQIIRLLQGSEYAISLDMPLLDDSEMTRADLVAASDDSSPDRELMNESLKKDIAAALTTLSPNERKVVKLSWGLDDQPEHDTEEIAAVMHLSCERVRQILKRALYRLRTGPAAALLSLYL